MISSLIVAKDRKGLIGRGQELPWKLPMDLRRFRNLTMGKPLLMGRRTYDSIGRPLPGRQTIILTRNTEKKIAGCETVGTIETGIARAREIASSLPQPEWFVTGGADIYQQALPAIDRIYLTIVDGKFEGDVFFPIADLKGLFLKVLSAEYFSPDENNPHGNAFVVLEKASGQANNDLPDKIREMLGEILAI